MKRVAFYTNMPSPYRVNFFNLLGKHCALDVFFEMDKSSLRDNSWQSYDFQNFSAHFIKGFVYSGESSFCPSLAKEAVRGCFDLNIVCDISSLSGLSLLFAFISKKIPYVIEGDGAFDRECSWTKAMVKRKIFSCASKLLYTSDEHKAYLKRFGAKEERLFWYPFSSVFEKDIIDLKDLKRIKNDQKEAMNIKDFTFLSVGRFLGWKDFETLIRAFCILNQKYRKTKLIIIGGEPTPSYKKIIEENKCRDIRFLPFMSKRELFRFMQASDCFCFSSLNDIWGLVINEAMANGLPIISSDGTLSSVEMSKDNPGIRLFSKGNIEELTSLMADVLNFSVEKLETMSRRNIEKIHEFTIETMVDRHVKIFSLEE